MAKTANLYFSAEWGGCEDVKTAVKNKNYYGGGVSAAIEMINLSLIQN